MLTKCLLPQLGPSAPSPAPIPAADATPALIRPALPVLPELQPATPQRTTPAVGPIVGPAMAPGSSALPMIAPAQLPTVPPASSPASAPTLAPGEILLLSFHMQLKVMRINLQFQGLKPTCACRPLRTGHWQRLIKHRSQAESRVVAGTPHGLQNMSLCELLNGL